MPTRDLASTSSAGRRPGRRRAGGSTTGSSVTPSPWARSPRRRDGPRRTSPGGARCTTPSTWAIVVAGKCSEPVELEYFRTSIEPRLGPDVTIVGTADAATKRELLARATALVFPILWEEPFGMVMIEAMACGTPVVALRRGAVPEVVVDGVTGILCDDPADLPAATTAARNLSPAACRAHVENCFDAASMVGGYEAVYREVLA